MSSMGPREPVFTVDGELVVGREALQVPISLRTGLRGETVSLELEAQQAATSNQTVRLGELDAAQVRVLRDELDALLLALE